MHLPVEVLGTDAHMFYRANGTARMDITAAQPVLGAYQNGACFYCGEPLDQAAVHVDHVIPCTFLHHDEIWNLVLAHEASNHAKGARLPSDAYLARLYERNEYYIASNHPIKRHLLQQSGATAQSRRTFYERIYAEAQQVLIHVWSGSAAGTRQRDPLAPLQLISNG